MSTCLHVWRSENEKNKHYLHFEVFLKKLSRLFNYNLNTNFFIKKIVINFPDPFKSDLLKKYLKPLVL